MAWLNWQEDRDRPYEAGRSTKGFVRGDKVWTVAAVMPGDLLIGVSHQFKTVNLYRVVGFNTKRGLRLDPMADECDRAIFYVVYICPDGSTCAADMQEMRGEQVTQAVWDHNLTAYKAEEWFKALAV